MDKATPSSVAAQLLSLTDGTPLDRERMATTVRDLLLNTPMEVRQPATDPTQPTPWKCGNIQLPKFNGYEDHHNPSEFLEKFENFCLVTGIRSDKRVRQVLPAALEGTAKLWWRFSGGFEDWDTFTKEFHAEFASVD
ncbi:hypothetical protein HPB47_015764 [Ixodes persulcatus]|uniref:Uncharacterized protein n=1 Tax=Ixodes persulcatus TaxID=34615 RepID=A0AC60QSP5_IXOPE|nr:hypothetical protein HPB47_015764 [Ixodes persulcatus]